MKMKTFLAVLVCFLTVDISLCINKKNVTMPPEISRVVITAVQKCMAETGVFLDTILLVYQGGHSEEQKFKDFIYCCYKNSGYLKPDGQMNTHKIIKQFKYEPAVVEGATRCGEETGRDAEDAVFNYFKCFQDTVPVRLTT